MIIFIFVNYLIGVRYEFFTGIENCITRTLKTMRRHISYIFNPKNITVVGVIFAAIGIGTYMIRLSMKFDYMLTINNGYRCNISENSILIVIFAVAFFAVFALFAIGEAVSILEHKRRFQKKLPNSIKRSMFFNIAFAICALTVIIIVLNKCGGTKVSGKTNLFFDFFLFLYKIGLI